MLVSLPGGQGRLGRPRPEGLMARAGHMLAIQHSLDSRCPIASTPVGEFCIMPDEGAPGGHKLVIDNNSGVGPQGRCTGRLDSSVFCRRRPHGAALEAGTTPVSGRPPPACPGWLLNQHSRPFPPAKLRRRTRRRRATCRSWRICSPPTSQSSWWRRWQSEIPAWNTTTSYAHPV